MSSIRLKSQIPILSFFFLALYLQQKPKILLIWKIQVCLWGPTNSFTNWLLSFTRFWHSHIYEKTKNYKTEYWKRPYRTVGEVCLKKVLHSHQSMYINILSVEKYELSWQKTKTRSIQDILGSPCHHKADTLVETGSLGGILKI